MSVEQLQFNFEDGLGFITIKFEDNVLKLFDSNKSSEEQYSFNRSEAHLLYLYLQEHLK